MAQHNLRICSLNVNGIRDYNKRLQLFTWLRMKGYDIIFLQETHCCNYSDSKLWEKEWGGACLWSFGGTRARGTAVLFRDGLSFSKSLFYYDAIGRLVVLDIKLYDQAYRLINVYAPNKHAERVQWFNDLHRWFIDDKIIIFGGKLEVILTVSINNYTFTLAKLRPSCVIFNFYVLYISTIFSLSIRFPGSDYFNSQYSYNFNSVIRSNIRYSDTYGKQRNFALTFSNLLIF